MAYTGSMVALRWRGSTQLTLIPHKDPSREYPGLNDLCVFIENGRRVLLVILLASWRESSRQI
jgi:hypothetical protein